MTQIKVFGVPETTRAFRELPRGVKLRRLRVALNAGGGVFRDAYKVRAHRETGLLAKSIGVGPGPSGAVIPDASHNPAHHGKPARVIIGVKKKAGRMMRVNKQGNLKGFGAAQRELKASRDRLSKEGKLTPRQRERFAVKLALKKNAGAVYRNPSRYAHLAGPKRDGASVLAAAFRAVKTIAVQKVMSKLHEGIQSEAKALAGA